MVPLLDSMLRGKKLGGQGMASIALAIFGVGLLQLGPAILEGTSPLASVNQGDAFCLGQALLFGIGYWRLEDISSRHSTQAGRITVGQLVGVAVGATIFCGATTELATVTQNLGQWLTDPFTLGALGWTALVSTALALYLETVALKAISASELTILMTSVSLFGSAFAYVTMGEVMAPIGMVGGLMILAGCVFSSLGPGEGTELTLASSSSTIVPPLVVEATELDNAWDTTSFILEAESSEPTVLPNNATMTVGLYA